MTTVGLEPTIFGSEDRRLIHWATRPMETCSTRLATHLEENETILKVWHCSFGLHDLHSVVGLVVRISAFHADGPGSIPGRRSLFLFRNALASRLLECERERKRDANVA